MPLSRRTFLKSIIALSTGLLAKTAKAGMNVPIYLTFDDGLETELGQGNVGPSVEVIDILAEKNAPSTFFVHGRNISLEEGPLLARILDDGHVIANHAYHQGGMLLQSNPTASYMAKLYLDTEIQIQDALADYPDALATYTSPDYVHMFRRPGGGYDSGDGNLFLSSDNTRSMMYRDPYLGYYWDLLDSLDGVYDYSGWHVNPTPLFKEINTVDQFIQSAMNDPLGVKDFLSPELGYTSKEAQDGLIILLHDPDFRVIDALPTFIDALRDLGAEFHVLPRPVDKPNTYTVGIGREPTPIPIPIFG